MCLHIEVKVAVTKSSWRISWLYIEWDKLISTVNTVRETRLLQKAT